MTNISNLTDNVFAFQKQDSQAYRDMYFFDLYAQQLVYYKKYFSQDEQKLINEYKKDPNKLHNADFAEKLKGLKQKLENVAGLDNCISVLIEAWNIKYFSPEEQTFIRYIKKNPALAVEPENAKRIHSLMKQWQDSRR